MECKTLMKCKNTDERWWCILTLGARTKKRDGTEKEGKERTGSRGREDGKGMRRNWNDNNGSNGMAGNAQPFRLLPHTVFVIVHCSYLSHVLTSESCPHRSFIPVIVRVIPSRSLLPVDAGSFIPVVSVRSMSSRAFHFLYHHCHSFILARAIPIQFRSYIAFLPLHPHGLALVRTW